MFNIPSNDAIEVGADGKYDLTGFQSFILNLGIWFSFLLVIATFIYFLYSYFHDFTIHPEYRREMRTISIYFFSALILGVIFALIFGGTDPITRGDGSIYDNKSVLMTISTVIWTAIILLAAAVFWSLRPLFKKS